MMISGNQFTGPSESFALPYTPVSTSGAFGLPIAIETHGN
jgi:hypothetical protein